jgi:hypothetical protein
MKSYVLPVLMIFGAVGCSNSPKKVSNLPTENQSVTGSAAAVSDAHNFVEIQFQSGSAALTDQAKTSLASVIDQARADGRIEEVLVLSWSDKEYPSESKNRLTTYQADLAERRNQTIEKFIETMSYADVETYNMAKKPNVFSSVFNTADTRMKNSFIAAGLSTTDNKINTSGKASHAVVLVKVE